MKKRIWWILIIAVIFIVVGLFYIRDSSVECCLCNSAPLHAPALVNLSTGEILELTVYDTDPFRPGELAEEQLTGTFSFIRGAGVSGYRESGKYVKATVTLEGSQINKRSFCRECRQLLAGCKGYALVDIYDPCQPVAYPVSERNFELRCYKIDIVETENKFTITVKGK